MIDLTAPKGGVTALVFYSSECPISNAYSPTLNALVGEFPEASLKLVGVCVDPDLTDADVRAHAEDFGLKFPVVCDRDGALAAKLGVKVTPEAFVIDAEGRVRYHGRIDDQFAARQQRNANPTTSELNDAIAAVLAGRAVVAENVPAVGCPIPVPQKTAKAPTYCKDVAAILQKNCQECHRRGQVGPFPLETYEQARKRADDIASGGRGPADAAVEAGAGGRPEVQARPVAVRRRDRHADGLGRGGHPEGDPGDLPPAPTFPDDWTLGTPDLVLDMPEDFQVPAAGDDIYRCFVVPTDLPRICTSRRSSIGPATAGSFITSWPTSTPRPRPGRTTRPTRARATPASPAPASKSTATWAAGRPATSPAACPTASAGSCPGMPT